MEKTKLFYPMVKRLTVIGLFFLLFFACKGQNKGAVSYPKDQIMNTERFDIEKFKKDSRKLYDEQYKETHRINPNSKSPYQEDYYPPVSDTLSNGTLIQRSTDRDGYFEEIIPPFPSIYIDQKTYYSTGTIKSYLKKGFIGTVWGGMGIFEEYNEQGQLVKRTDYNRQYEKYKIKLEDLLNILSQKKIIDLRNREEMSLMDIRMGNGIWWVIRHIPISEARVDIEVDAQSGKILSEKKEGFFSGVIANIPHGKN